MKGQEGAGTERALGVWADHLKREMNRLGNPARREPLLAGSTHYVVRAKKNAPMIGAFSLKTQLSRFDTGCCCRFFYACNKLSNPRLRDNRPDSNP